MPMTDLHPHYYNCRKGYKIPAWVYDYECGRGERSMFSILVAFSTYPFGKKAWVYEWIEVAKRIILEINKYMNKVKELDIPSNPNVNVIVMCESVSEVEFVVEFVITFPSWPTPASHWYCKIYTSVARNSSLR